MLGILQSMQRISSYSTLLLPALACRRHKQSLTAASGHDLGNGTALCSFLSVPSPLATQAVTDCCLWSRSRRRHPTHSRLSLPNVQRRLLPNHTVNVILSPSSPARAPQRAMSRTLVVLPFLATIRTKIFRPHQLWSPRSLQVIALLQEKSPQHLHCSKADVEQAASKIRRRKPHKAYPCRLPRVPLEILMVQV